MSRRQDRLRWAGTALLAVLALPGAASAQCVLCREVVRTGSGSGLLAGLRLSYALLVLPFLVVLGGFGFFVWRTFRRPPDSATGAGVSEQAPR